MVACWEFLTPLVARLAADLGLPGNDASRALSCRNKRIMARAFAEHARPGPRTLTPRTVDEAHRSVRAAGLAYPLVVKPAEQSGSWGVAVVHSDESWRRPSRRPSPTCSRCRTASRWTPM